MDTSTSSTSPSRAGEYEQRGDYHREPDPSWRYYPVYVEKMARVRAYLDRVPAAQARILDVGCGEGLLVEEYRTQGRDIQGLDLHYSSPFVTRGDLTQLPWEPGSFDLVLALDVIEHLGYATQAQAFSELARVLKPGGRALVSLPNLAHFASRLAFLGPRSRERVLGSGLLGGGALASQPRAIGQPGEAWRTQAGRRGIAAAGVVLAAKCRRARQHSGAGEEATRSRVARRREAAGRGRSP